MSLTYSLTNAAMPSLSVGEGDSSSTLCIVVASVVHLAKPSRYDYALNQDAKRIAEGPPSTDVTGPFRFLVIDVTIRGECFTWKGSIARNSWSQPNWPKWRLERPASWRCVGLFGGFTVVREVELFDAAIESRPRDSQQLGRT
jgi:hypothetical protein